MFFGKGGSNDPTQRDFSQMTQQQQQQIIQQRQMQNSKQPQAQQQQRPPNQNYYQNDPRPLKLGQVPSTLSVNSIPQEKQFEIELLEGLLEAYFNIVRKNIQDSVPKAIMFFMVTKSKSEMQNELIQKLYKENAFEHLLSEGSDIVAKRAECKRKLELLNKSQSILSEVRDYSLPPTK